MSLRWKINRLMAMEPYEVFHRLRVMARDKFMPPAWETWSPREASERWQIASHLDVVRDRLSKLTRPVRACPSLTPTLVEGESLLNGQINLFGREVRFKDLPNWRANPFDGREWQDAPSKAIDYRRADIAGGAKYVWELGRLTFLGTLATCFALTKERQYLEKYQTILSDFCTKNPVGHGIHHTSGIEQAVRNITILFSLSTLLHAQAELGDDVLCRALGLCGQQALHCWNHLSVGSSGNNHLVAELAGTVVAAAILPFVPELAEAAAPAWKALQTAVPAQFHADGVPAEQSFRYIPFVWELILAAWQAGTVDGREWTPAAKERLGSSLEFVRLCLLDSGELPPVGDEDDGRIFFPADGLSRACLAGNALAARLGMPRLSGDANALSALLSSQEGTNPALPEDGKYIFAAGGYTLWRRKPWLVLWDHGPLGFGRIAAHGHADANMLIIYCGRQPVICDPGTYEYHGDVASRDQFRSTPWHSTVSFHDNSQSENLGPFLWGKKAEVHPESDGYEVRWFSGERHWRRVEFEDDRILLEDRIAGDGGRIVFPLGPGVDTALDGHRVTLALKGAPSVGIAIEGTGIGKWTVEPMGFSPRFSWKEPSRRLIADIRGHSANIAIELISG